MFCQNVRLERVTAVAPPTSRNTDGFDPDSCKNVYVNDCVFDTGDDCIAVKSGRYVNLYRHEGITIEFKSDSKRVGQNKILISYQIYFFSFTRGEGAVILGLATENVLIENCEFRNGHGVTVGSEMSGGVRNVTFRNSRVIQTKV